MKIRSTIRTTRILLAATASLSLVVLASTRLETKTWKSPSGAHEIALTGSIKKVDVTVGTHTSIQDFDTYDLTAKIDGRDVPVAKTAFVDTVYHREYGGIGWFDELTPHWFANRYAVFESRDGNAGNSGEMCVIDATKGLWLVNAYFTAKSPAPEPGIWALIRYRPSGRQQERLEGGELDTLFIMDMKQIMKTPVPDYDLGKADPRHNELLFGNMNSVRLPGVALARPVWLDARMVAVGLWHWTAKKPVAYMLDTETLRWKKTFDLDLAVPDEIVHSLRIEEAFEPKVIEEIQRKAAETPDISEPEKTNASAVPRPDTPATDTADTFRIATRLSDSGYSERDIVHTSGFLTGMKKMGELIDKDGRIFSTTDHIYDDKGQIVEFRKKRYYENGKVEESSTKYTLDDKGNRISEVETTDGEIMSEAKTDYGDEGNMLYADRKYRDGRFQKAFYRPEGMRSEYYGEGGKIENVQEQIVGTKSPRHQITTTRLNHEKGTMQTDVSFSDDGYEPYHSIVYAEVPIRDIPLPYFSAPHGHKLDTIEYATRLSDDGKTAVAEIKNISQEPIEVDESSFHNPAISLKWFVHLPSVVNTETISLTPEDHAPPPPKIITLAPGESIQHTLNIRELLSASPEVKEKFPAAEPRTLIEMRLVFDNLFPVPPEAKATTGLRTGIGKIKDLKTRFPEFFLELIHK